MTPDRWQKVQQLFYEAEALAPSERLEFLQNACEGEESLRREVETLLGSSEEDGQIEAAVGRAAAQIQESVGPSSVPEQISEYRIIRQLGEGGMGVVYEAEQPTPRRLVALKVIRSARYAGQRVRRLFQREAEALGRLKHPGIATIYRSGVTDDGVPFIAMELVSGTPVNDWINSLPVSRSLHKSDVGLQLRVFRSICDAMLYAHQNGVIHRDLKPSNVFVLDYPEQSSISSTARSIPVKVLDFGLARILEQEAGDVTESGIVQGSVPYMSPEQASGQSNRIDIRTDIYALGVMLFWMLTRHHPYLDGQTGLAESLQLILQGTPRRFKQWFAKSDLDLESIALKALEKDPERRYQSVSTLAGDIDRYIEDQPILARPPNTFYEIRKLIKRNRGGFAAVIALLILVSGFTVSTVMQLSRIRVQRDRANQEAATAKQVSDFLGDLFRYANPAEAGGELQASDLLKAGKERISKELGNQPELRARLLDRIGDAYEVVGPYSEAYRSLEESIRIRENSFGKDSLASATSWNSLAILYFNDGKSADAETAARRSLAIREAHLLPNDPLIAESCETLSRALLGRSKFEEAEKESRRAVDIDLGHPEVNPRETASRLTTLGLVLRREGKYKEAIVCQREALRLRRTLPFAQTGPALNELGLDLEMTGDLGGAEAVYREDLEVARKVYGPQHRNTATVLSNIASCLDAEGHYKEAETTARQALQMFVKAAGPNNPRRGDMLETIASSLVGQGRTAEAGIYYREWYATAVKGFGIDNLRTARAATGLADWEARFGDPQAALRLVTSTQATLLKLRKSDSIEWALTESAAGEAKASLKDYAGARALLAESRDLLIRKLNADHWQTRRTIAALAKIPPAM